jgi:hypothetical protein
VLFSNAEVAQFINATFEPAWESLRPVPIVTIDFGNGKSITRTLHGNIATYVCNAAGTVIDVLPGVYTPAPYREQLALLAGVAKSLAQLPEGVMETNLRAYHTQRAAALNLPVSPQVQSVAFTGGGFKGGIGGGFQAGGAFSGFSGGIGGIQGGFGGLGKQFGFKGGIETPLEGVLAGRTQPPAAPVPAGELAKRPELALDAEANEKVRRRLVHQRLSSGQPTTPDGLKRWLFKEVLYADLDDPMLGLGAVLDANYPFADEDAKAGR